MNTPPSPEPTGVGQDDPPQLPRATTRPAVPSSVTAPAPANGSSAAPAQAGTNRAVDSTNSAPGLRRLARWHAALLTGRDRLWRAEDAESERVRANAYILFAISVLFYVTYQLATRGRMIISGSMWAEMGTNYYATTAQSWFTQLYATDVGYIPLPQRLFALLVDVLGVPPSSIPYAYTGCAVLMSGVLIGSLCLPVFRPILRSDALRFALSLALMAVPEFATRTFINFTYFGVVLITAVTALALVDRRRDVPGWAWVIPILVLSKPGVLAAVPAIAVAALVSRRRFRLIAAAAGLAAAVQAASLVRGTMQGASLLQDSGASAGEKMYAAVKYTLGFLGRLVVGPAHDLGTRAWLLAGIAVLLVSLAVAAFSRSRAGVLIPLGLSLIAFTMLINSFSFSTEFTRNMAILGIAGFDRRFIVAVIGAMLVVAGGVAALVDWVSGQRVRPVASLALGQSWSAAAAALLFLMWFCLSGWLTYVPAVNQPLGVPVADISQWEEQAQVLASDESIVCIPLDPFGWLYGRNCTVLDGLGVTPQAWAWAQLDESRGGDASTVSVQAPEDVRSAAVSSVALMVRPPAGVQHVSGTAVLTAADGSNTEMRADADLTAGGGLIQFSESPAVSVENVRTVTFTVDDGVSVASSMSEDPTSAIVLWMGQPGQQ